jgi:hypothetical protein
VVVPGLLTLLQGLKQDRVDDLHGQGRKPRVQLLSGSLDEPIPSTPGQSSKAKENATGVSR